MVDEFHRDGRRHPSTMQPRNERDSCAMQAEVLAFDLSEKLPPKFSCHSGQCKSVRCPGFLDPLQHWGYGCGQGNGVGAILSTFWTNKS